MKKYEYVRMKLKPFDSKYSRRDGNDETHRDVIGEFAARGYRFVGIVPVRSDSYGRIKEYDLVFEIEE